MPRAAPGPAARPRPDHPDTLTTRHHIARWTGEAGNAPGAAAMPRAAPGPAARPRARPPRHAANAPRIAHWTGECPWTGEAEDAQALRLYRELLPDQERVLGPDHPDTLLTRCDIAHWTGEAGDAPRRCGYAASCSRTGSASSDLITPTRWDAPRHRPLDRRGGGRAPRRCGCTANCSRTGSASRGPTTTAR